LQSEIKELKGYIESLKQIVAEKDKIIQLQGIKMKEVLYSDDMSRVKMLKNDYELLSKLANPHSHKKGIPSQAAMGNMDKLEDIRNIGFKYGRNTQNMKKPNSKKRSPNNYNRDDYMSVQDKVGETGNFFSKKSRSLYQNSLQPKNAASITSLGTNPNLLAFANNNRRHPTFGGQMDESIQFETMKQMNDVSPKKKKLKIKKGNSTRRSSLKPESEEIKADNQPGMHPMINDNSAESMSNPGESTNFSVINPVSVLEDRKLSHNPSQIDIEAKHQPKMQIIDENSSKGSPKKVNNT